jgi:hypothetical protein
MIGLLAAYSVEKLYFKRSQEDSRPSGASFHFGRGGKRDLVLRATRIVLIDAPAIHKGK